jgi:hypothetical protein
MSSSTSMSSRPSLPAGTFRAWRTAFAAAALASAIGILLASPASAKYVVEDRYIEVPQCQPATTEVCPQVPTETFYGHVGPTVSFTANANHCSDIIAHIIVDGVEVGSDEVGPGQTTRDFNLASLQRHTIGVQAEGVLGGCNTTGTLGAWGGTLHYAGTDALS